LKKNVDLFKVQTVNFVDFFEALRKSQAIITKEKVWNIFKNEDTKNQNQLSLEVVNKIFKQNFPNV
jgi:hypothetical protein